MDASGRPAEPRKSLLLMQVLRVQRSSWLVGQLTFALLGIASILPILSILESVLSGHIALVDLYGALVALWFNFELIRVRAGFWPGVPTVTLCETCALLQYPGVLTGVLSIKRSNIQVIYPTRPLRKNEHVVQLAPYPQRQNVGLRLAADIVLPTSRPIRSLMMWLREPDRCLPQKGVSVDEIWLRLEEPAVQALREWSESRS